MSQTSKERRQRQLCALSERQNHRCAYCGVITWIAHFPFPATRGPWWMQATVDHVIPKSEGGNRNYDNCVMACSKCNSQRKSENALTFFKRINLIF